MSTEQKHLTEIEILLSLNYQEIVDYLLNKYGTVPCDYMTNKWNRINKISRTNEGLVIHHIDEDKEIMLSNKQYAMRQSFEYQKSNRLVYCNLLEHLILHVKITELDDWNGYCGIGGVCNFLVPELNDIYSGIKYEIIWKQKVAEIVKPLKKDYLNIIKHISKLEWSQNGEIQLLKSYNETYKLWNNENNEKLYEEMKKIGILDNDELFVKYIQNFCDEEINSSVENLAIYYFNNWIDITDKADFIKHEYLTLKETLTTDEYFKFIIKITNPKWYFFTIKKIHNNEFEYFRNYPFKYFSDNPLEYFYFNENEYDKYLKKLEYSKEHKILYKIQGK